jgi:PAS domain S-box-containing protein
MSDDDSGSLVEAAQDACGVIPIGLAVFDRDGCCIWLNHALAEMRAEDPAALLGRHVGEVMPGDAERIAKLVEHTARSGIEIRDEPVGHEGAMQSGSARSWLVSCFVRKRPDGEQDGVIAMLRDATADRFALHESEARFRQAVESAPDGLAMVDATGHMRLVNSKMELLFGYTRSELLDRPIDMLMPDRYRARHGALMQTFFADPSVRDMANRRELYARRKDGSEFPVEIGLNPIPASQGQLVLASIADVTARKAAQAEIVRALAEKTALLDEVHHRVKNNLQVVSSLLNLQMRHAPPEAQASLLESQHRVRAMALIHQLLYERRDFSEVDLGAYLMRLAALLRDSLMRGHPGLGLRTECDARVVLNLQRAVPCGLLVNELVTNAVKHAFPDGRPGQVLIALHRDADGAGRIVVEDDGIGLPAHIEIGAGSSIGFQLVPLLVDQLQGRFDVRRSPGTRFDIVFHPEGGDS